MGKLKTIATTAAPYYLYIKMYAFKSMAVIKDKHGKIVWRTVNIFGVHNELSKIGSMAIEYALDKGLVYLSGLVQGQEVRAQDIEILEKHYGVCFSELIT
ncbi:hypothetical protein ES708_21724 [subsurface metagenome]